MGSPGGVRARKSEPVEWMLLDLLDPQKTQAYPKGYEEARQPLVTYLLSVTPTPVVDEREQTAAVPAPDSAGDHPDFEREQHALSEHACECVAIAGPSRERQHDATDFTYVSSFDRLTSRKPKSPAQPISVPVRTHLRNVLRVTVVLSIVALAYAWAGGGFPALSAGFRSFLQVILRYDGFKDRATPVPFRKDADEVSGRSDQRSVTADV